MLVLDAIGNPVRRQLLDALRGPPRTAGELAATVPTISRPAVSRHLRLLREAGLVRVRARGRERLYQLHPPGFASVGAWAASFWDAALPRFAEVARALGDEDGDPP
ncbi:MAG: metalloregulator ArsR/SmtB family transcription factor [Myxococcota bacterium]